jgi:hypothetical protein
MAKQDDARVFEIETRFQRLARREGGVPKDKAIEQAQSRIEKVKPSFDDWFDKELAQLTSLIADAQAAKAGPDWVLLANARSRQLCDASGTLGFPMLAFIAKSLCDILDSVEASAECNMEAITCHVDALNLVTQKSYRRLEPEQMPELTDGLRRVVQRVTG